MTISPRAQAAIAAFGAPGTFRTVAYHRPVALAAAARRAGVTVTKTSTFACRAGVDYRNLAVNAGRAPESFGGLPYGEWVPGFEGLILLSRGAEQLRVTYSPNAGPRSLYRINGAPAARREVAEHLTPAKAAELLTPREDRDPAAEPVVRNLVIGGILMVGKQPLVALSA